jgi:predicted GNAT family acetyltransferase
VTDEPTVRDNRAEHRFDISVGGDLAGSSFYEQIGNVRAFVHTEIDERFAGQGLGGILVRAALTAMKDAGTPVLPFCPFVRRYIQRHPEFLPLVPTDERARFGLPPDEVEDEASSDAS